MPQPASGGSNGNGVEEAAGGGGEAKVPKDLSHVPCKFFRVGGCTAGLHCALAHVLPGQSPSMDRRNKKAAQMARTGEGAREGRGGRGGKKVGGLPITMSLKASISPSAPAPALKDADFSSFAAMARTEQTPKKEEPKSWASVAAAKKQEEVVVEPTKPVEETTTGTLPMSTPRHPLSPSKPPVDFGPIGSPPRSWGSGRQIQQQHTDTDADGGEMFLPGSLSDLLTADELARRVSKSVPAPSLLSATQTPHNASGAFLSRHTHYPTPNAVPAGYSSSHTPLHALSSDPYGDDRGAAMGVSLPRASQPATPASTPAQGASATRRSSAKPDARVGRIELRHGRGQFWREPAQRELFRAETPPPAQPSQGSYKAPGGLGGVSFKDRPVFGVIADMPPPGLQQPVYPAAAAPSFNAGRDRFADRAAGIPERTVEDDDLFVLDG
ncbi:hypothetical protein BDZ89DRAFT_1062624 [Hymenopellis radicata]|nr:hypothetical protein BDZ89DRAFT_1062624 [Hymenopellis radicata]